MGYSAQEIVTRDASGREVRRWLREPDPTVLEIVHFVDLDDGRRVTTEHYGKPSLQMWLDCTEEELLAEVRECVFVDEMREIPEDADEPRWPEMIEELARTGVAVDEATLEGLPFVVEVDERVRLRS
ncbi:MAG TPA: hypothetical protein VE270_11615 [Thermoleophilaceae bacterium]|nr:hypothetical protein [Thermoleophilaceae bacterium]